MTINRGGYYRTQLFLSISPINKHGIKIESSENLIPCLTFTETVTFITWLSNTNRVPSKPIIAINKKMNTETIYSSIREAATSIDCDIRSISPSRKKLFRDIYEFKFISTKEYVELQLYPPFVF
jgi:hypothetical protein